MSRSTSSASIPSSPRPPQCVTRANRQQGLKAYKQHLRYQQGERLLSAPHLKQETQLAKQARNIGLSLRPLSESNIRRSEHKPHNAHNSQPPESAVPARPRTSAPANIDVAEMFNSVVTKAKDEPASSRDLANQYAAASSPSDQRVFTPTCKARKALTFLGHLSHRLSQSRPAANCTRTTVTGKVRINYALFNGLSAEDQLATALQYVLDVARYMTPKTSTILNGASATTLGATLTQLLTRPFMPAKEVTHLQAKIKQTGPSDPDSLNSFRNTLKLAAAEGKLKIAGAAADIKALIQIASHAEQVLLTVALHNAAPSGNSNPSKAQAVASEKKAAADAFQLASTLRLALTELGRSIAADDWVFQQQARAYAAAA